MERSTKLIVFGWAALALGAEIILLARTSSAVLPVAALLGLLALALAAYDRRGVAVVLAFAYIFPAVIYAVRGSYHVFFGVLWMSALFGAMVPDGVRTPWHIPTRWRATLVLCAFLIGVGTTIVVFREIDFNTALLAVRMPYEIIGSLPPYTVTWTLHVALTLLIGILWFDWLFGAARLDFLTAVVAPLAVSALLMSIVSIYQLFINLRFLNETVFAYIGRATGTVFDANVCGAVAAMWVGGAVLATDRLGRWRPLALTGGLLVAWLAVWASGSRSAFAAAVIASLFNLVALFADRSRTSRPSLAWKGLLATAAVVALLALLANANLSVVGPVGRVRATLPEFSAASLRAFVVETWNRNEYGSAATAMIKEFPLVGIGIGSFQLFLRDFAPAVPVDNAQNWYRHQLAEFGIIGCVGWILWVASFATFVLTRGAARPAAAWAARGTLVAFALISLMGMPGQDLSVAITFWTIAFWYVSLAGAPAPQASPGVRSWAFAAVIIIAYAAGTANAAVTRLRLPERERRSGRPYSYGFYPARTDEAGQAYRWARGRAVAVLNAPTRWMILTVWVTHADISTNPVDVKVWRDGALVLETRLQSTAPVTKFVRIPAGEKQTLIDTWVSRVVVVEASAVDDGPERGLLVKWSFVDPVAPAEQ